MNQTHLKYHSPIPRKGIYNNSVKLLLVLSILFKNLSKVNQVMSMELSNLYFKGVTGQNFYQMMYFCPRKIVLSSLDEKQPYVAFHLGLHCLPKYLFTTLRKRLRVKFNIYGTTFC